MLKTAPEEEFEVARCVTKMIGGKRSDDPFAVASPLLYLYNFPEFSSRNLEFFISLLAVVTYTNRKHRRIINGKIISTELDFDLTKTLWTAIQKYQVTHLPEDAHTILDSLPLYEESIEGATLASIQEAVDLPKSSVRRFVFGDDRDDEKLGLFDLGLIVGRKKPNTDGEVTRTSPWEFWRKADSCYPQLTPNLDRADLTEQDIIRALNEGEKLVPESQAWGDKNFFSDILKEIKNITPSYLEIRNKYFDHEPESVHALNTPNNPDRVGRQLGLTEEPSFGEKQQQWVKSLQNGGSGFFEMIEKNGEQQKKDISQQNSDLTPITDDDLDNLSIIEYKIVKYLKKRGGSHFNAKNMDDFIKAAVDGLRLSGLIRCSDVEAIRFALADIFGKYEQRKFPHDVENNKK